MLSKQEITRFLSEDYYSELKQKARKGRKYYHGKHDIAQYRLFYFDADGNLREDRCRSNVKIPHPFFTEIVNQAVQYTLSGNRFLFSENPRLQKKLDEYFNYNDSFINSISNLIAGCMSKGCEYLYIYRNSEGKLSLQTVDSLCVTEVTPKMSSDKKEYIIYSYSDTTDYGRRKVKRIQVWDNEKVYFYMQHENGVVAIDDTEKINPVPHTVSVDENGDVYAESFGFIPFFRLDNNNERESDLFVIKELIDDYDLMASSLSNNLIDFDMPLYAVTGFDGDNLDELQQNLKTKKIVGLEEGGGVEVKTIDVPYQARQTKLELDEKNIYRFGMGLNINSLRDTSSTTNIAIKAAYSLLDLKCAKLEMRLKSFLCNVINPFLREIGDEIGESFEPDAVKFYFKHEVMSNAYENAQIEKLSAEQNQIKMQTLMTASEILDDETLLRSICDSLELNFDEVSDKLYEKKQKNIELSKALESTKNNEKANPLNGAQMSSLLAILSQYKSGFLSAETAAAVISVSFGITEEKAARLLTVSEKSEGEVSL